MPSYLVFRLFGPMAAWGDIAIGERRHVFPQPTKSAILGLVAGALGLRRTDDEQLRALHGGYGFASRVDSPGLLLTDFHTAQTPPESAVRRAKGFRTRQDELSIRRSDLETILSYRDYQTDALAVACLWGGDNAPYSLEQLADALRRPAFAPYLGRRSCSPSIPFAPQIVEETSPTAALRIVTFPDDELLNGVVGDRTRSYYWEGDIPSDMQALQTIRRRDIARSRTQWQFAERAEHHALEERPNVSEQD
ncbi:MAG TPA: type I-E CRISPR-associated protein Cas5/CasD [Thermoanaerobaculia bacterium]|nr:type I-E CRISPR-associated protein Cas5/CasD [Thermoanaerobaculia bacterium]